MGGVAPEEVIERYRGRGVCRGAELYFDGTVGEEIVRTCEEQDLAVIGVEGFELVGKEIRPRLDLIADYSTDPRSPWTEFRSGCNRAALDFLRRAGSDIRVIFCFVLQQEES
jgi:hypothetical protein